MKIAIVHDDFVQWGGAERLVAALAEIFPNAPVYTSMLDEEVVAKSGIRRDRFVTSWLDSLPFKRMANKALFDLYPSVFESFDFGDFNLVISSSARFAHSVITPPGSHHVAYINSPFRGFWDGKNYFGQGFKGKALRLLLAKKLSRLREWDYAAGQRPDKLFGNSGTVVSRIKKYWRREAEVFYPFVDFERFDYDKRPEFDVPSEYFMVLSRLIDWKRIDIVVEAFVELQQKLIVVGDGPDKSRLKRLDSNNVLFTGFLPEPETAYLLKHARALIHPQKEDFGMTIPEANYCRTPVIAYAEGGALETVIDGVTGVLFREQSAKELRRVIENFERSEYKDDELVSNAERFSKELFVRRWRDYVDSISETD